jgi:hypothetical protein
MIIYILELIDNKYYVGKTNNIQTRLFQHTNKYGSMWTKIYKPIKIKEIMFNCDDFDEDKYTIKMMSIYGINNVRGGSFVKMNLSVNECNVINRMINGALNLCYNCGDKHFINKCKFKFVNEYLLKLRKKMISMNEYNIDQLHVFKNINQKGYKNMIIKLKANNYLDFVDKFIIYLQKNIG